MKKAGILLLPLTLAAMTGCGNKNNNYNGEITINFWHTFGDKAENAMESKVKKFVELVKENEGVDLEVVLSYQGAYKDMPQKVITGLATGDMPTIAIAYPDHVAQYMNQEGNNPGKYIVNFDKFLKDESLTFGTDKYLGDTEGEEDMVKSYLDEGRVMPREGTYLIPLMKSTEIMCYNLTAAKTAINGSLAEKSEILLKQWDYDSNGDLSPYEIPLNYSFKVDWKCDKCGYRWASSPNSRVRVDKVSGCPHCTGRVAMPGVDDLETLYPDIAKEWDYQKNKDTLPSQVKPHSNRKYYWICPQCGKSYETYPGNRVNGSGCPDCAHRRIGIKNSKLVGQFDDNGTLINTFQGLHQAAKVMQLTPNSIFQAVKNERKSKGYYWRYIINVDDK